MWILGPLLSGVGGFFIWRKLKKHYTHLKHYYHLVLILVDAIEKIEKLTDIIPDKAVAVAQIIKRFVRTGLSKEDRQSLDEILSRKGYLHKEGG